MYILFSSFLNRFPEDFQLESDWTEIVADASRLSERKRQQQTAIWELIQTEAAYIETIEVITKV
jgi:pleckstrin domain-containing family G protein 5